MGTYKKLTLLHSNDMHGDFLAEKIDENLSGGVSLLSGYVNKVRNEKENVLYCIAGDMFRGSVIDSEFKGVSTIEIMNAIAPDVVTLGNHETDYGIAHLLFLEKCAKFPIINANLYIKSNMVRLFRPHVVLEVDGMKILFIGIITENVMRQAKNEGILGTFLDIHEAAEEVGKICNAYNALDIDLTVLLTHIGFEEDKQLAEQLDPAWGVDLIIGGHSHTFIEEPYRVNDILIVQAGIGTDQIGRFDLLIDTDNNCIHDCHWRYIPICPENCPNDEAIEKILHSYKSLTDKKYMRMITRLRRTLTHPDRYRETELGDLFADILKDSLALDVMLLISGSIRREKLGPLVQYADLVDCFPYDEDIRMLTVSGKQLKRMMAYVFRDEVWQGAHSSFFQISRDLRITYDISKGKMDLSYQGKALSDETMLRIGLQKYQYNSFEKYFNFPVQEIEEQYPSKVVATSARSILEEYLSRHQNIDQTLDGRITLIRE